MRLEQVKEIANAVLYEGYLLYPYRHSAIKNRQRWTFGVVYPREYSQANGGIEPWTMRTECLVTSSPDTVLDVHVRFLHLLVRSVGQTGAAEPPSQAYSGSEEGSEWSITSCLEDEPWEEGMEREVSAVNLSISDLLEQPQVVEIAFPGGRMVEESPEGTIVREQQALRGAVIIAAEALKSEGLDTFKISVQVENRTPETGEVTNLRNAILQYSFVSTHTILQAHMGAFVSLMDPPEVLRTAAQACQNTRTWPVLAGDEGERDMMLSSPIILYDYPQIAPESPGSLFDGTEIDEILTLRIMTLSDEEKEQIRRGDERAREILERTESLSPEQFMKLHGTIRSLRPVDEST